MEKRIITREMRKYSGRFECQLCGWNTDLLVPKKRVVEDGKCYCPSCYTEGKDKKTVTPGDFYFPPFHVSLSQNDTDAEIVCRDLPHVEIAHLYGEAHCENDMHLDLYYDRKMDKIYFRMCIVADDDPWFGTESYKYLSIKSAIALLNQNGIHAFDGMNESNHHNYFEFALEE